MSSKSLLNHAAMKTGRSLFCDMQQGNDKDVKEGIQDGQEECLNTFNYSDKENIILNIGEYKDYLDLVSHAVGISIPEYILSIIQKDELLALGERIKSRE